MTREEAIDVVKKNWPDSRYTSLREALEFLIPEFRESKDERIRKALIYGMNALKKQKKETFTAVSINDCLAWLEKQKEQPQEELVYRLNGLMQEYIKEGKDEAEKEHRFKCYQLFWDALEDTDFFEQKEQKPIDINYISGIRDELLGIEDSAKDIDGLTNSQWVAIRAAHRLLGEYIEKEQKSAGWNPTNEDVILFNKAITTNTALTPDERAKLDIIRTKFKHRPAIKQEEQKPADEQFPPLGGLDAVKAKYYDDGFKNGFDEGVTSVKPTEWSEEDKVRLDEAIEMIKANGAWVRSNDAVKLVSDWLESLPERFVLQPKQEWSEEDESELTAVIYCVSRAIKASKDENERNSLLSAKNWLQDKLSFRVRSLRPSWKPSEEQLELLDKIYHYLFADKYATADMQDGLGDFIDDLKELM